MKDLNQLKKDYARLLIREGLNVQKGQRTLVQSPVECAEFARLLVHEAYEAGSREVIVKWYDDFLARERYLYAEDSVFDEVHPWDKCLMDTVADEKIARIVIYAEDPENLKGVDSGRITREQVARGAALEKFRVAQMRNEFQWNVCSVPTVKWAKAVFPDLSEDEAMEKLWEAILKSSRVDGGDAVENWSSHSDEIQAHVKLMNDYDFKSLHYTNSLGTDFTVELPENHYWAGGAEKSADGIEFSANIPTEEIFTLPLKDSANGKIVASKPLCLNGNIIENFYFIVKDGKIVEAAAAKGEDILKAAIAVDEGASYFGEVALVPYDSPISDSGILFLNTLFDENASCHIAFGEAYPCIHGAEGKSDEELKELGVNYSMMHEDFMVGTRDLSIVGTTRDGREIQVFKDGNFAF